MKKLALVFLICLSQISFGHVIEENETNLDLNSDNIKENSNNFRKIANLDSLSDSDSLNSFDSESSDLKLEDNKNEKLKLKSGNINPVILIPGLEGSQLMATLNKSERNHYYCKKTQKTPFIIWINYEEFVIPAVRFHL